MSYLVGVIVGFLLGSAAWWVHRQITEHKTVSDAMSQIDTGYKELCDGS